MKNPDLLIQIAERLMRCPAAPYHEQATAAEVMRIGAEHGLACEFDRFGNILARVRRGAPGQPLILAAHLDHPGFVIRKRLDPGRWRAEFLGGVGDAWFKPGVRLRIMPGSHPAVLRERLSPKKKIFAIESSAPRAEFAVWDLPEFQRARGLLTGRVCDDLIGVACILAALAELKASRAPVDVIGAFSRAEEVGFHGALALAKSGALPKDSLLISLETSRELPPVKIGEGVIVRVGDRASTFDSAGTRYLVEVAGRLAKKSPAFRVQRALMQGGTCEATAYQEYGYRCAAVCVALGNYHNCGADEKVGAEFVSEKDAIAMASLMIAAAQEMRSFKVLSTRLNRRLERLASEARRRLRKPFP
jgi:endoglucanase